MYMHATTDDGMRQNGLIRKTVQQFPLFSLLPLSPPQQNALTVIDVFIKVQPG